MTFYLKLRGRRALGKKDSVLQKVRNDLIMRARCGISIVLVLKVNVPCIAGYGHWNDRAILIKSGLITSDWLTDIDFLILFKKNC